MCKEKENTKDFFEDEDCALTETITEETAKKESKKAREIYFKGNIDRISEGYFVVFLDIGSSINLPVEQYPDLKPGQIITLKNFEIEVDEASTAELKEEVINLQNALFK